MFLKCFEYTLVLFLIIVIIIFILSFTNKKSYDLKVISTILLTFCSIFFILCFWLFRKDILAFSWDIFIIIILELFIGIILIGDFLLTNLFMKENNVPKKIKNKIVTFGIVLVPIIILLFFFVFDFFVTFNCDYYIQITDGDWIFPTKIRYAVYNGKLYKVTFSSKINSNRSIDTENDDYFSYDLYIPNGYEIEEVIKYK